MQSAIDQESISEAPANPKTEEVQQFLQKLHGLLLEQHSLACFSITHASTSDSDSFKDIHAAWEACRDDNDELSLVLDAWPNHFEIATEGAEQRVALSTRALCQHLHKEVAAFLQTTPSKSFPVSGIVNLKAGGSEQVINAWRAVKVSSRENEPRLSEVLKQRHDLFEFGFDFSRQQEQILFLAQERASERREAFHRTVLDFFPQYFQRAALGHFSVLISKLVSTIEGEEGNEAVAQAWHAVKTVNQSGPKKLAQVLLERPDLFEVSSHSTRPAVSLTVQALEDLLCSELEGFLVKLPEKSMKIGTIFGAKTEGNCSIRAIWKALRFKTKQSDATDFFRRRTELFSIDDDKNVSLCQHFADAKKESYSEPGHESGSDQQNRSGDINTCIVETFDSEESPDDSSEKAKQNGKAEADNKSEDFQGGSREGPLEQFEAEQALCSYPEVVQQLPLCDMRTAGSHRISSDPLQLPDFRMPPGLPPPDASTPFSSLACQMYVGDQEERQDSEGPSSVPWETFAAVVKQLEDAKAECKTLQLERKTAEKTLKSFKWQILHIHDDNDSLRSENAYLKECLQRLEAKSLCDQQRHASFKAKIVQGSRQVSRQWTNTLCVVPDSTGSSGELDIDSCLDVSFSANEFPLQGQSTYLIMDPCAIVKEPEAPADDVLKNPSQALLKVRAAKGSEEAWDVDDECLVRMEDREARENGADRFNDQTFGQCEEGSDRTDWSRLIKPKHDAVTMQLKLQKMLSCESGRSFHKLLDAIDYLRRASLPPETEQTLCKKVTQISGSPCSSTFEMLAALDKVNVAANIAKHTDF